MKKKILLSLLIVISIFAITGCGKDGDSSNTKNYSLGDVVETDILKFKLIAGEYTYALVNTNNDDFASPKEYDASTDNRNPYVASKGHTYAAFTFYVENLDRSSVEFGGSFNSNFTSVEYGGEKYNDNASFKAKSEDNLNWSSYSSSNVLLLAGKKEYYRAYVDISTDVKNLDDTLELTIYLPTSEGKNKAFKYVISEEDRNNYKGEEITLDVAIKNFKKKVVKEYFSNHLEEYIALNGNEIKTIIDGNKFNVSENGWEGTFTFENSGRIYERSDNGYAVGYTNNRTWYISENKLTLSWVNSKKETKSTVCEVKKIQDGVYLLLENGEPFGIIYK